MDATRSATRNMNAISYAFMALTLGVAAWLHLATPLLVALFGLFVLNLLHPSPRLPKWSAVVVFLLIVTGVAYALAYFIREAVASLPAIADKSIPSVINWAEKNGIELPFTDYKELKQFVMDALKDQANFLGTFLRGASMQVLFILVGCVVAVSIFLNPQTELDRPADAAPENLYALFCDTVAERFALLFKSFATVMGAQITISAINTVLTGIFVLVLGLPHPVFIIGLTFLCGLLPVVGNLVSNTFIVAVGFSIAPKMALACLIFLVVIHKLEYFLNSRIIGARIRNPVWLMLLSLILGEKLMGIPGMILAPVILHYVKTEMSRAKLPAAAPPPVQAGP
jgi:predicted PurR-regulated permease PerM